VTALTAASPHSTTIDDRTAAAAREPLSLRALRLIAGAALIGIPLFMSWSGYESFRLPKELLFRALALLALALFTTVAVAPRVREAVRRLGREAWLGAALILWTIVSMLASAYRANGLETLGTLLLGAALFVAFLVVVSRSSLSIVYWTFIPAAANVTLFLLQRVAHWSPFGVPTDVPLLASTSFLGNANDLGMTLLLPTLAAYSLVATDRKHRRRWLAIAFAAFGTIGLVASESVASLTGFAIGLWLLLVLRRRSWKKALLFTGAILAAGAVAFAIVPQFRARVVEGHRYIREQRYNELLSGRLVPSLVAVEMVREHPIAGAGPGSFRAEYFDKKLLVDRKYKSLMPERMAVWSAERMMSFGETHDDHLQILAELGLPGYALFVAILVLLARRSLRAETSRPRAAFARDFALPAVVAFAISILAQFPLRLAAPLTNALFFAAVIAAWSALPEETE
jgi:putative inorganic carbon (HCO3(-)) transporter